MTGQILAFPGLKKELRSQELPGMLSVFARTPRWELRVLLSTGWLMLLWHTQSFFRSLTILLPSHLIVPRCSDLGCPWSHALLASLPVSWSFCFSVFYSQVDTFHSPISPRLHFPAWHPPCPSSILHLTHLNCRCLSAFSHHNPNWPDFPFSFNSI